MGPAFPHTKAVFPKAANESKATLILMALEGPVLFE